MQIRNKETNNVQTDKKIDIRVTDILDDIEVTNAETGSEKILMPLCTSSNDVYKVEKTALAETVKIGSKVTILASRGYSGQMFFSVARVNKETK